MGDIFEPISFNYTLQIVLFGSTLIGFISGCIGSFVYLRKQSLVGDAISHATLPGIAGIFLLTGDRSILTLLLGAAISGCIGILVVIELTHHSRIKMDSALGIVLSVFFGLGIVLITYVNSLPRSSKAGLEQYIFGQAAIMNQQDIWVMSLLGVVIFIIVMIFWKEFQLISFDRVFAQATGLPIKALDIVLMVTIVLAIVIGLQTVGVILMSAMIAVPAASARQWTNRFGQMVLLSGLLGSLAAFSGVFISSSLSGMPTGPVIVVIITMLFVISLFFAPKKGLLFRYLRIRHHRKNINCDYAHEY